MDDIYDRVTMLTDEDRILPTRSVPSTCWTASHLMCLASDIFPQAPVISAQDVCSFLPELALWDIWPILLDDGTSAEIAGGHLWIILSAPRRDDPSVRHNEARMRLLHRVGENWHDCGNLLPDGFSPGSREWSGAARLDPETGRVTLWFTATGHSGETALSFEQRLFHATGTLDLSNDRPRVKDWCKLSQFAYNDGTYYTDLTVNAGVHGIIKGFRDPFWFRDPADGRGYILFFGSKPTASSQSDYNGVIGIAAAQDDDGTGAFTLLPHLIDGDSLTNELELPHLVMHDGLYYLFWSTQAHVFAPDGPIGPTGLYGMVAPALFGPYTPLNGSGLVIANPVSRPLQAYAWKVLPSLEVISFVDYWGVEGRDMQVDPALKAAQFGGTIAPMVQIKLDGSTSSLVHIET